MRKTLLLAFQWWSMLKERHLSRNYLINRWLILWWYSHRTAKRVKTVPPGTITIYCQTLIHAVNTLWTNWWLIEPWQQHLWKVLTVPGVKMGAKCCRIGPKFWPNQKGMGKIHSQRILRFLDLLSYSKVVWSGIMIYHAYFLLFFLVVTLPMSIEE